MQELLDNANGAAARLIQFGLQPTLTTVSDQEYHTLLQRYFADDKFRERVASVGEGLGLVVHATSAAQLILVPTEGSVFRARSPDNAAKVALAAMAIAASFWPTPLEMDRATAPGARVPRIKKEDAVSVLRRIVDKAEPGTHAHDVSEWRDADIDHADRNTLFALVRKAVEVLVRNGMIIEDEGEMLRPTLRFATVAYHLATSPEFNEVQNA
jgi:hypothetical protein